MNHAAARRLVIEDKWADFLETHPLPTDDMVVQWLDMIKIYCTEFITYDDVRAAAYDAARLIAERSATDLAK